MRQSHGNKRERWASWSETCAILSRSSAARRLTQMELLRAAIRQQPDLAVCAQEPIHTPGATQPHGALLAVDLLRQQVSHASANLASVLGVPADRVLGRSLAEVLGERLARGLQDAACEYGPGPPNLPLCQAPDGSPLHVVAHLSGDHLCVDLEPIRSDPGQRPAASAALAVIDSFKLAASQAELCRFAVRGLKAITGYDRVMAYRFAADGHGEVIAEAREPELEPYLGQHYPASDIPPQARRLYLRNGIGVIPDAAYVPCPLLTNPSLADETPLDLTFSALRSVSPLHREYMRNMGTAASMTLALAEAGELWGILVCHHVTPRLPHPDTRLAATMVGRVVSLLLESLGEAEVYAQRLARADVLSALVDRMAAAHPLPEALALAENELLAVLDAGGVVLRLGGTVLRLGRAPPRAAALHALDLLLPAAQGDVLAVDDLVLRYPELSDCTSDGSGVLLLPLASHADDAVMWFRPELLQSYVWGGDPGRHVVTDVLTGRLSPRQSFAAWQQTVQGRSARWEAADLAIARNLRRAFETEIAQRTRLDLVQARNDLMAAELRDGHQRAEAARQLSQLEGKYRALLDAAPDALVVVDARGEIRLVNREAERRFGYSREALLGQGLQTIIPDGSVPWLHEHGSDVNERAAPADANRLECMALRRDGSAFPIEVVLNAVPSEDEPLVTVAIRDITERRAQQAKLVQIEQRHRGLLEAAPDAMVMADARGCLVVVNREAERQFGYGRVELIGQPVTTIIPEGLGRPPAGPDRPSDEVELTGRRKDGSSFPLDVILGYLDSDEGVLTAAAIRDVTARKRVEAELVQKVLELNRSNEDLANFATIASHDLQEPLRMVASYTQLLARRYKGRLDSDADEFISFAVDGASRMQQLIQDLLAYARIKPPGSKRQMVSSSRALNHALSALRGAISATGAVVTSGELPNVPGDEIQLVQLFQNLVGNAIKYRRGIPPEIHVSATHQPDGAWTFCVRDNGMGIERRYFDRIFGMFQRLHKREEFSGTGMGLAICKKIV